jgi:hypothetical protein
MRYLGTAPGSLFPHNQTTHHADEPGLSIFEQGGFGNSLQVRRTVKRLLKGLQPQEHGAETPELPAEFLVRPCGSVAYQVVDERVSAPAKDSVRVVLK